MYIYIHILPETKFLPLKRSLPKRKVSSQPPFFRGSVSFRDGTYIDAWVFNTRSSLYRIPIKFINQEYIIFQVPGPPPKKKRKTPTNQPPQATTKTKTPWNPQPTRAKADKQFASSSWAQSTISRFLLRPGPTRDIYTVHWIYPPTQDAIVTTRIITFLVGKSQPKTFGLRDLEPEARCKSAYTCTTEYRLE